MKTKILFIFFGGIAIIGLLIVFQVLATEPERILFMGSQNLIIKYSAPIIFINLAILLILVPVLIVRGIIPINYYGANDYLKAKANFIVLTISAPAWILLTVSAYCLANSATRSIILGCVLLYIYISCLIKLIKTKNQQP